jgi:hypothetical protein
MRSAVVIVFFCVLAVATSVLAEGAWTLWMMGGDSPWDSVGSFPTREECVTAHTPGPLGGNGCGG